METTVALDTTVAPPSVAAVLVNLQNGDRACYVVLRTSSGEQTLPGSFELCAGGEHDATALIGMAVTYRTEQTGISAASCEGNPDCSDTDMVDLVTELGMAGVAGTGDGSEPVYSVGELRLGVTVDALKSLLGAPDSKSDVVEEAATGLSVSTWTWADKGISLVMAASGPDQAPTVDRITVTAPSTLRTAEGIGVGATEAAVTAAYGPAINKEESSTGSIVVGSVFGGMIFTIERGTVSSIFIGAAAE